MCNLFTGWEVVVDYIQKIDLITFTASDFLCKKAMLQKKEWLLRNVITYLYFE